MQMVEFGITGVCCVCIYIFFVHAVDEVCSILTESVNKLGHKADS